MSDGSAAIIRSAAEAGTAPRSPLAGGWRRPRCDDRGAVLIEAALVLPVLALLMLGIIEFGMAFRQVNVIDRGSSSAARVGATLGNAPLTDYEILRSVNSTLNTTQRVEIERVIVYRSTTADGAVPPACLAINPSGFGAFGVAGTCNVYSAEQVANESLVGFPRGAAANPSCAGGSWDANWCPIGRSKDRPNPDVVGVFIEGRYDALTSLIPGTGELMLSQRGVYMLEPPAVGD
ncbi:MAG: pilus assembly protein [Acidimicrobiia bacterium]|nr:pilus assembly protein [Acidimicrobiia bacterium]